ncbi:hypothetical protein [Paraburkholderia strydomiana]|uniref:hypothetical protein n=1 Tax=Paraburkholderia strydomiana TaxID=1245417 RepID=UPI0035B538A2
MNPSAGEWGGLFALSNDGLAEMHGVAETLSADPYAFFRGFLDGKVPVLNVVNEIEAPKAAAWLKENAHLSSEFVIKLHMSHWSDPDSFNRGVDAFLKTVK